MLVKEIMSPEVESAAPYLSLQEAARKMRDRNIGCLPVRRVSDGELIGMVTDRDIALRCVAEGFDPVTAKVGDVMSPAPACCFEDQEVGEAARIMEQRKLHRLPVLNRAHETVGILSLTDLALNAPEQLSGEVVKAVSQYAA